MHTFKKEERLCSKKLLEKLFHSGSSFLLYPFKITWIRQDLNVDFPCQVVISVSKRNFKRAVDRNLLKRRIREAYRLNKSVLYTSLTASGCNIIFAINFIGKEIVFFDLIEKRLKAALVKLEQAAVSQDAE